MRKNILFIAIWSLLLLGAATASAQGGGVPAADPTETILVEGYVDSFTAGSRSGMPLLVVDDVISGELVAVALGPAWFLQEAGFSVLPGDFVEIVAYPCASCAAENVAASVLNTTNGTSVELRGDDGVPLWLGGYREVRTGARRGPGDSSRDPSHGDSGQGNRTGGTWGLDMTTVTTVTGTVEEIREEKGTGEPHLRLMMVDGTILRILLNAGAYNLLEAAGVLIQPGMELTVTWALTKCSDPEMVAISLIDPVLGLEIQLRDPETGFPIMGSMHGNPR